MTHLAVHELVGDQTQVKDVSRVHMRFLDQLLRSPHPRTVRGSIRRVVPTSRLVGSVDARVMCLFPKAFLVASEDFGGTKVCDGDMTIVVNEDVVELDAAMSNAAVV